MTRDLLDVIHSTANLVLEQEPDAVPRFRLLRDVLRRPADDEELNATRIKLNDSKWVRQLAAEQHRDGGWGRFHSRDYSLDQAIITTEIGVGRAIALGLDREHPILERAANHIRDLLHRRELSHGERENNDRWTTGVCLFTAATLALIEPEDPAIKPVRDTWLQVASRTLVGGGYDPTAEQAAHAELHDIHTPLHYLKLNNRYTIQLLGSGPLDTEPARALLQWLWHLAEGIGYLREELPAPAPAKPGAIDRWLTSHELLSAGHLPWADYAEDVVAWLMQTRGQDGFWDLDSRPAGTLCSLPLSESWHAPQRRRHDWTTRILTLLRRYAEQTRSN